MHFSDSSTSEYEGIDDVEDSFDGPSVPVVRSGGSKPKPILLAPGSRFDDGNFSDSGGATPPNMKYMPFDDSTDGKIVNAY